jgi:hypothetical protein
MEGNKYTYTISKNDYLMAVRLKNKPSKGAQITISLIGLLYLLIFFLGIYYSTKTFIQWQTLIPISLIPFFFLAFRYILTPIQVRRVYDQQSELHKPIDMEITEDKLISSNDYGHSRRPWSDFTKWKEDENLFLLYHSDAIQTMIPKRIFSSQDELNNFRRLLTNNISPTIETRPIRTPIVVLVLIVVIITLVLRFRAEVP